MAGVVAHEIDHDVNQSNIVAMKDRQEGHENNTNVEESAENMESKVYSEIEKK